MAESTIVRVKKDGDIMILDGAAHSYNSKYEPGDFGYTVPDYTVNLFLDRGEIGTVPSIRIGDEQPMTLSWSNYMRDLGDTAGSYATLLDILHRYVGKYVASNWVSTMGANSDVFTLTVSFSVDGSPFGEADKTVTFPYCVLRDSGVKEGDPNTVGISGTSYCIRPVLT